MEQYHATWHHLSGDTWPTNDWCHKCRLSEVLYTSVRATTNFKANHVDSYDSDYDDEATANAIFMANLSLIGSINDDMVEPRYDSNILSEVPHNDTYHESNVLNSDIQELEFIENIVFDNESYDELTSNNNVISYADYMVTIGNDEDNYVPPLVQNNDRILSVIEHMKNQVEKCNMVNQETQSVNESLTTELDRYRERVKTLENESKRPDREKCLDCKLRTTICDRNIKVSDYENKVFSQRKQMENLTNQDEVEQCSVAKKCFEIEKKQLLINNDRLLEENISCDIMYTYSCSLNEVDNCGQCKSLDIVLLDLQESNKSLCELRKHFSNLEEYSITLDLAFQNHKEKMINDSRTNNNNHLVQAINNQSFEINDLKVKLQDKTLVINELKYRLAQLHGKSPVTQCESPNFDSRIQKIKDENMSLAFQVPYLVKEREHI
ncbi:hypothetical protein Tco_1091442, partial [Tanacetum coccineum]